MSKNKFFKKLLVGGLCALTATAMIGATACNKGGDGEEETGHTHNYATEWSRDASGHWYACLNSGHTDEYEKIPHVDDDGDGECDACHWDMSIDEDDDGDDDGDGSGNETVTPATQKVVLDVKDVADSVADGGELKADTGIYAAGAITAASKSGSSLYNNEAVSFTKAIKTGGIAKQGDDQSITNAIKFNIENDNSTIVIYASSGTSNQYRSAVLKDSKFADVQRYSVGNGNGVASLVFEVKEAGTYYFGGASAGEGDEGSGGIYIYYMAVWEGGKLPETTVESKTAADPTCDTAGNITYTKTSFGRFLNSKGEAVAEGKVSTPALGHDYELDYESLDKPTETEEGSIELICNTDSKHNKTVVLPVLGSEGKYEVTTQDKAPEGTVQDGEAWYSYVIPEVVDADGKAISVGFAAKYVEPATYQDVELYSNFLSGTVNIGKANATSFADGIKIYGRTNLSEEISAWSESTYSVTASNDKLTVLDKGYDPVAKTGKAAYAYIIFDNAYSSGVYKVTGTINLSNFGNGTTSNSTTSKWSPLQLIAEGTEADADTFASMRTDSSKLLGVAQGMGGDDVVGTGYGYAAGTDYNFEFIINLDSKEVKLVIYANDAAVYSESTSITAEKWGGLRLHTADNADRTIVLSNLVISQRTVVSDSSEE